MTLNNIISILLEKLHDGNIEQSLIPSWWIIPQFFQQPGSSAVRAEFGLFTQVVPSREGGDCWHISASITPSANTWLPTLVLLIVYSSFLTKSVKKDMVPNVLEDVFEDKI